MATDKKRVSVYVNEDLKEKIEKLATLEGRSVSNYIEQLLKKEAEKILSA